MVRVKWLMPITDMWVPVITEFLYTKGKRLVKSNIESKNAVEELIRLIKDGGDWK